MGNERDGAHPSSARVDHPYWAGLEREELLLQRCARCSRWSWPADWRCPACGSYDLGWEEIEPRGVIYSWVRTHVPLVALYADLVPYVNVLVELPQAGGARLLGMLTGHGGDVEIGARVTGTFRAASPRTIDLPVLTWALAGAE